MTDGPRAAEVSVYVGLGANLDDPRRHVELAIAELAALPRACLVAASALYRTAPVGPQDQPHYINAVAHLATDLSPMELLRALQGIERRHGRVRDGTRWGPRTLDLDILLYGDHRLDQPGLHLPHAQMHRRAFVLVPLADVADADLMVPGRDTLGALLAEVDASGVAPLPSRAAGEAACAALS